MKKILLFFTIALLAFNLPYLNLHAQETVITQTSLGVDPAILEVILEPGIQTEKIIHVNNSSNLPLPIKAISQTFVAKEIVNVPKEKLNIFDSSSWLELAPEDEDFILQPKEVKEIKVKFNPPENAAPGGHYASLIFQPLIPQELVSNQSVFVYARVAVLVFMQVKGDIQQNLEFNQVKIDPIYNEFPIKISTTLKNVGNTHLRPEGKLIIFDEINHTIKSTIEIVPSIVLPELTKDYPVTVDGIYDYGQYSAQFQLSYGDDHILLSSEKFYFTVIPYKSGMGLLAILIVIYLMFFKLRKRIKKAGKILFESSEPTLFTSIKRKTQQVEQKKQKNLLYTGMNTKTPSNNNKIIFTIKNTVKRVDKLKLDLKTLNKIKKTKNINNIKKNNLFTHISIKKPKTFTELQKEQRREM